METPTVVIPQPASDEHFAIDCFMEQVVKEIKAVQSEREAAYERAMKPLQDTDE